MTLSKNIVYSSFSAVSKIIGGIGLLAVLARTLSLSNFGEFTYAFTFGTVLSLIVDFGFNIKLLKDISHEKDDSSSLIGSVIIIKLLILGVVGILSYLSFNFFFNTEELPISAILILFLSLCAFSFTNLFLSVFKAKNLYRLDMIIVVVDSIFSVSVVTLVSYLTGSILLTSLALLFTKVLTLGLTIRLFYTHKLKINRPNHLKIRKEMKAVFPFAIHYLVGNLYLNIDTLIIKDWITNEELAIYQAGIRIIIGSGILLTVVNSVFLPSLTKMSYGSNLDFRIKVESLNGHLFLIAIAVVVFLNLFSFDIISIIFGKDFLLLNDFFWIFSLIIFLRIIGAPYGILLTISDKQYLRALAGFISLIAIILLDQWLVPLYGITAAAYVLLIGHIMITLIYFSFCFAENKSLFLPSFKQLLVFR